MQQFPTSLIEKVLSLSDDLPHPITTHDIPFYTCNFHVYTHPIYYGASGTQRAAIYPNDICWFENGNLRDFRFKNLNAGDNGLIVAEMTVPNAFVKQALGL